MATEGSSANISKYKKKCEKNTTQKYIIRTAGFGKYKWLVLHFFCNLFPDFHSEHGVGSLAYFWICLFFVFCIFEILGSYFFFILYFWNCWFVFFLYFVFLRFVFFCIFCICFVFFCRNTQKIRKIPINYKKTLCIFVFLHYVQKCNLYFCMFFVFFQSFTDCTLSFCIFSFFRHAVKEQNRESINVCCIFLLLMMFPHYCCIVFVIWTCIFCIFCIFNDYRVHSLQQTRDNSKIDR